MIALSLFIRFLGLVFNCALVAVALLWHAAEALIRLFTGGRR